MLTRFTLALTILTLVAIAAVFGKRSDTATLAAVGKVIAAKAKSGLPESTAYTQPLNALKPSDRFPLAERVRARIQNDKLMQSSQIDVLAGALPGEVRLRGRVPDLRSQLRAVELALETVGVETVTATEVVVAE